MWSIVICIRCNQTHIFVDSALKSQTLWFTHSAPFAVKWAALAYSSDNSKFLYYWLWFLQHFSLIPYVLYPFIFWLWVQLRAISLLQSVKNQFSISVKLITEDLTHLQYVSMLKPWWQGQKKREISSSLILKTSIERTLMQNQQNLVASLPVFRSMLFNHSNRSHTNTQNHVIYREYISGSDIH